jgi:hypothetical protein
VYRPAARFNLAAFRREFNHHAKFASDFKGS